VIVIFLQLILFANAAAFFCSLLGIVSHSFREGDNGEENSTRSSCVEEISHLRQESGTFLAKGAVKPTYF